MTKTILERGQAIANTWKAVELATEPYTADSDLKNAIDAHHDALNKFRHAFGIDLVEPENLRSGVIAFSGGTNKDNPPPPPGGA